MHGVLLKTANVDCCRWQIMATVMQPFKSWAAAAVFCKTHEAFNSGICFNYQTNTTLFHYAFIYPLQHVAAICISRRQVDHNNTNGKVC
jgi:hypothetical protein